MRAWFSFQDSALLFLETAQNNRVFVETSFHLQREPDQAREKAGL